VVSPSPWWEGLRFCCEEEIGGRQRLAEELLTLAGSQTLKACVGFVKMKTGMLVTVLIAVSWQCFAQTNYFPAGSLDDRADMHTFISRWYSKHLSAMQEPALPGMTNSAGAECYRFLYLPTWGHPVAVRVTTSGEVFTVHATALSGQGGYDPGTITNQSHTVMGKKDSDALRKMIAKVELFKMRKTDDTRGCDGEEWVLEGVANGKYCAVTRWCPVDYDTRKRGLNAFVTLCRRLLGLASEKNKSIQMPGDTARKLAE
jgi:hypothetical protein